MKEISFRERFSGLFRLFRRIYAFFPSYLRFFLVLLVFQILSQLGRKNLLKGAGVNFLSFIMNYLYMIPLYAVVDFNLKLFARIYNDFRADYRILKRYVFRFSVISILICFLFYIFIMCSGAIITKLSYSEFTRRIGSKASNVQIFVQLIFFFLYISFKTQQNLLKIFTECERNEILLITERFFSVSLIPFLFSFLSDDSPLLILLLSSLPLSFEVIVGLITYRVLFERREDKYDEKKIEEICRDIDNYVLENELPWKCFQHMLYRISLFLHFNLLNLVSSLKFQNMYFERLIMFNFLALAEPFFMLVQKAAHRYLRTLVDFYDSKKELRWTVIINYFLSIFLIVGIFYLIMVYYFFPLFNEQFLQRNPDYLDRRGLNFYFFYLNLLILSKILRGFKQFFASLFVVLEDDNYHYVFGGLLLIEFIAFYFVSSKIISLILLSLGLALFLLFVLFGYLLYLLNKKRGDLYFLIQKKFS